MPVELFGEDIDAQRAQRVVWRRDEKDGEIAFGVRAVPASVDERIRAGATRGLKSRQLSDQPAARLGQQLAEISRRRAAYALTFAENFEIVTRSADVAEALTKAIDKEGIVVAIEKPFKLDDYWTDDLKLVLFRVMPKLAAWGSDTADDVAAQDAEEEVKLGKI